MTRYFCCDERRRELVREIVGWNGIDFLEVVDRDADTPAERQRVLRIHLLKSPDNTLRAALVSARYLINGGVRVRAIKMVGTPKVNGAVVTIHVNEAGDFSVYSLSITGNDGFRLAGMDPLLSEVEFRFKVECPSDLDCATPSDCPSETYETPEIDYLAKDYASFRRLMLDRLAVTAPSWKERSPADLGVALVELLAFAGDYLSYEQDAIATEAYLSTAQRRTSLRRHARLLDYRVKEGCNSRVWVHVEASADDVVLPKQTQLLTTVPQLPIVLGEPEYTLARSQEPVVFETMHDVTLYEDCNRRDFHTWGSRECCLPEGSVHATLAGPKGHLERDQVLVFVEDIGPRTGEKGDADPRHRHAVRLTDVNQGHDDITGDDFTEIEWDVSDALPFPLCISATTDELHRHKYLANVSYALGNVVLADHGRTIADEELPAVPSSSPDLAEVTPGVSPGCDASEPELAAARYRPRLKNGPLTMTGTASRTEIVEGRRRRMAFDRYAPADAAFRWDLDQVSSAIQLKQGSRVWLPQRDLLGSSEFALDFVVENEDDGSATLRFGDDEYGTRPGENTVLSATYRVGKGTAGNVGAGSISHIFFPKDPADLRTKVSGVDNPMPARGGVDPETMEEVRQSAPYAFRTKQRAVTTDDYAELAERTSQVYRAAATLRWTGSWTTVFLATDRAGGREVDPTFETLLRGDMERYRMAGYDLEVEGPQFVPLELDLFVCASDEYYRADVKARLLEVLSNRTLPDGGHGLFHPDNFTFQQDVYLSRTIAAAQALQGVARVEVRKFQRLGIDSHAGIDEGVLHMSRLEIARLDNDPNFPDRGIMRIDVGGGR